MLIEFSLREIQYIRAAVCLLRKSDNYPKNDIHFSVDNSKITQKLSNIIMHSKECQYVEGKTGYKRIKQLILDTNKFKVYTYRERTNKET